VADMPTSTVEHHDGVFVLGKRRRETLQEQVHRRGGDGGKHQAEIPTGRGFDGGEHIGEGVALIDGTGWPLAAQPPATAAAPLLAESGFILEIQRNPLVRMCLRRPGEGSGHHLF